MNKVLPVFISLLFISFVFISCDKEELQDQDDTHETDDTQDDDEDIDPAIVFTRIVEDITINSAISGGNITEDGGALVTARGVVLSNDDTPTTEENLIITEDGEGTGEFVSEISGLEPETTYYVRAYAINEAGTSYGEILSFSTLADEPETVVDIDGNEYSTVAIGEQVWMAENLKTTKYNDGEEILNVISSVDWAELRDGSYVYYNHDEELGETYGALYNYFAITTKKLCPVGWRVPDDNDWDILIEYLGGAQVAGAKLKATGTEYWNSPNSGANNESGFTALGAGYRYNCGEFDNMGRIAIWWSNDEASGVSGSQRSVYVDYDNVYAYAYNKNSGLSIRCIKN